MAWLACEGSRQAPSWVFPLRTLTCPAARQSDYARITLLRRAWVALSTGMYAALTAIEGHAHPSGFSNHPTTGCLPVRTERERAARVSPTLVQETDTRGNSSLDRKRPPGSETATWIGYELLDRLITYPRAHFLSRSTLPIHEPTAKGSNTNSRIRTCANDSEDGGCTLEAACSHLVTTRPHTGCWGVFTPPQSNTHLQPGSSRANKPKGCGQTNTFCPLTHFLSRTRMLTPYDV